MSPEAPPWCHHCRVLLHSVDIRALRVLTGNCTSDPSRVCLLVALAPLNPIPSKVLGGLATATIDTREMEQVWVPVWVLAWVPTKAPVRAPMQSAESEQDELPYPTSNHPKE